MIGTGRRVGSRGTAAGSGSDVTTVASTGGRPCSRTSRSCCLQRSLCLLKEKR